MKNLKRDIFLTLLFMTIGIAAVTSNILISGSTELVANTDDFDVYFSDPTPEKSDTFVSINNSKSFTITTELKELNEEDKVNFKVTNASQNYDAEVSIDCTSESVYLKATPHLSSNIVPAREEIDGSVSIKLVRQSIDIEYDQSITCTINANAVERTTISNGIEYNEKLVMLKNYTARDDMGFGEYKYEIRTITFEDEINIPDNAIETWDFGVAENGNVMAYIVESEDYGGYYDLYIQSDEQLYGNPDMSWWFYEFYSLETINNLDLLDTSKVTNMSYMFFMIENIESINLSNWDTSNVTNMSYMFDECYNLITIIGLENLDVSNVTNMGSMFYYAQSIESINLSGWDTSNVTNMGGMFAYTNISNLDLSELETSKVTNMSGMFEGIGNTTLDLTDFDTSNVTNMSYMFANTNISNLDLSELETSKVTDMSGIFEGIGNTTLDLTDFDTSNVTNMSWMFAYSNISNLDLNELETSNVTNMSGMFDECFGLSTIIGLENFDTSKVTSMSYMFAYTNISNLDLSKLETSNVTDMSYMFYRAGYAIPDFNIDLSELDTSSVTNMSNMFNYMGYLGTKLNTSITIRNPNVTSYSDMLKNVATKSGTSFTVNYTSETEALVDKMIATKSSGANVVKGTLVD